MCPNATLPKRIGYLSWDLFVRVADQVASFAYDVYLYLGGESLLHPDLARMIRYLDERSVKTILHTNAALLDEQKAAELLDAGLDILSFSLDGYTPEAYERIRRGACYSSVIENIRRCLALKKEQGYSTHMVIQSISVEGQVEPEVRKAFRRQFDGLPVDEFVDIPAHNWGGKVAAANRSRPHPRGRYVPCARPWCTLCVLWDGTIVPCCADFTGQYALGDANHESIIDVWNGERMRNLRRTLADGRYREIELCRDCDVLWRRHVFGLPTSLLGPTTHVLRDLMGRRLYRRLENLLR